MTHFCGRWAIYGAVLGVFGFVDEMAKRVAGDGVFSLCFSFRRWVVLMSWWGFMVKVGLVSIKLDDTIRIFLAGHIRRGNNLVGLVITDFMTKKGRLSG